MKKEQRLIVTNLSVNNDIEYMLSEGWLIINMVANQVIKDNKLYPAMYILLEREKF